MKSFLFIPLCSFLGVWFMLSGHLMSLTPTAPPHKADPRKTLQELEWARKMAEAAQDKSGLARALMQIGDLQERQGQYGETKANYERALKLGEETSDKRVMGAALNRIGRLYSRQGNYPEAIMYYQRALKLAEESGNTGGIIGSLNDLGIVYERQGLYERAIETYQRALKIAEDLKDNNAIAGTLGNLGNVYERQGSYGKAVACFEHGLKIAEELGSKRLITSNLLSLGGVYVDQGSYAKAIDRFQRVLKILEELGYKNGIATTLVSLGIAYMDQGLADKAVEYYQRALKLNEELENKVGIARTLTNLGIVYKNQGLYDKAAEYYQRALKIDEELEDKGGIATMLYNIGTMYSRRRLYEEAAPYFQKALNVSQEIKAKRILGYALNGMGRVYVNRQQYPQALDVLQQALTLGEELKEPTIIWVTQCYLADVYEKLSQPALALDHYQRAITEIEHVRARASSDEGKAAYFQDKADVYKKVCALLFSLHDKEPTRGYDQQALAYAEKARARAFVDLLAEGIVDVNKRLGPELQEKEKNVLARLSRANQTLQRGERGAPRETLVAEVKQLETEHDQLKEAIRRQDPAYANLVYPQSYDLEQIRRNLLDGETALVEYLLDDEPSFVYLVGRKELVVTRLPGRSRIEATVTAFLDAVKSPPVGSSTAAALQTASQNLYQDLLAPLAAHLSRYRRLIIAADGLLYYLPFEALGRPGQSGFRYLIEDHVISYAPSATALGTLLRRSRNRSQPEALLALGDPDFGKREELAQVLMSVSTVTRGLYDTQFSMDRLPFASEEVQEIARYFPRREIRVRREASEAFIKQATLENYGVIHFATHGFLDEQNPKASCIVLSRDERGVEDGFLQVREIYDLRLNADLVVLSACNTGRGRLINGEGVLGLNRAFFYAGARSVLSSLWSVNDRASSDFMNLFYFHLQKGEGKAEALRAAKLKFIKSATHAHPYYWAAFILQGEPKETLFSGTHWLRWLLVALVALSLFLVFRRVRSKRSGKAL